MVTKLFYCPNCKEIYIPEYSNKLDAPRGSIYYEQHLSGICSDKCWDEFLGVEEYDLAFEEDGWND